MADLRAQKLWKIGDTEIGGDILDKLKLNTVQLGIAEVDTALTSGKINAVFSSPFGAIAMQWHRKVNYMNSVPLTFAIGATVYALESQNRIAVSDRAEIAALSKRNQKKARNAVRKANEEAKQMLVKKGIVVVEPAKEMVDELTAAAAGVQAAMTGKVFSQTELDTVLRYREEYRTKNTKPAKP